MEYSAQNNLTVNISSPDSDNVVYWSAICGTERPWALWDESLSMNTTRPDAPYCLQNILLLWLPSLFLWLAGTCRLLYLKTLQTRHPVFRMSKLCITKLVISILLIVLVVIVLVKNILDHPGDVLPAMSFISPVIAFLTLVFAVLIIHTEFRKARHTSGVLLIFWLSIFIAGLLKMNSFILQAELWGSVYDTFSLVVFTLSILLCFIQVLVTIVSDLAALETNHKSHKSGCYNVKQNGVNETLTLDRFDTADRNSNTHPSCPELTAPFVLRITFLWLTKLIIHGYRKSLVMTDLWGVRPNDRSSYTYKKIDWAWNTEKNKIKKTLHVPAPDTPARSPRKKAPLAESEDYTNVPQEDEDNKPPVCGPSLWKVYMKAYGVHYLISAFYRVVFDFMSVIQPIILGALINFIMDESMQIWKGVALSLIIFFNAWLRSIFNNLNANACTMVGMRVRTMLTAAIYRKALRLSSAARKRYTTGDIVNMVAVDANKLFEVFQTLNFLWSTPIVLVISFSLLWRQLGVSSLAGLGMLVLIMPLNFGFARYSRVMQSANMKHKDARLKLLNEVLNGIKVLKLYAWEESFRQKVNDIRCAEMRMLRKCAMIDALAFSTWFITPFVISLACFGVYISASEDNVLDAHTAFVSLALIYLIHGPLLLTSIMIGQIIHAIVATKRIRAFLCCEEVDSGYVTTLDPDSDLAVSIDNGTFAWEKDQPATLKNINIKVREGSLVAIVGVVGSGKSSLISALLGEMECVKGSVKIKSNTAYVPQQAWVQNNTVTNNILFGRPMNECIYDECIDACALKPDLAILPDGDATQIGDKGVNLSGGQKQRVSLARSVYQDCCIYLLDDPLSAVDAHVGKHIFNNVIGNTGFLKGRTRILVTHNLTYLPKMDSIVVMNEKGTIEDQGTYDELLRKGGAFAEFLQNYVLNTDDQNEAEEDGDEDDDAKRIKADVIRQLSIPNSPMVRRQCSKDTKLQTGFVSRAKCEEDLCKVKKQAIEVSKEKTTAESVETGDVSLRVYGKYFRSFGMIAYISLFVTYLLYVLSLVGGGIWLQVWSDSLSNSTLAEDQGYSKHALGVYAALGVVQVVFLLASTFALSLGSLRASRHLHSQMLTSLLRSPVTFFDSTPLGRIINRFSKDIDMLDVYMPWTIRIWMATFSNVLSTIVVVCYSIPVYLALLLPMILLYFFVQRLYIRTNRQLKRLESVARSPLLSLVDETINGTSSIRAYQRTDQFIKQSDTVLDENTRTIYPNLMSQRWLQFILDQVGVFTILFVSFYGVFTRGATSAGIVGLAVSFSLRATSVLSYVVRMSCDVESAIVSAERILEYSHLASEADLESDTKTEDDWPKGEVKLDNYCVRYRADLPMVLNSINLHVAAGEKLGVVGRTGSGKSTLTLALFRILEPSNGSIYIDGVDITKIGLHQLRKKITIIPQDPMLFSGSLRENVDPFNTTTDKELWAALEHAQLKDYFKSQPEQLEFQCSEGGSNLSAGQKQLVCLARALVRKSRIIVLDEATASVDVETDEFIQAAIRSEFNEATVIIIAHRINTIMDCDRVLVLETGTVKELGKPQILIKNTKGVFYSMANDAGLV